MIPLRTPDLTLAVLSPPSAQIRPAWEANWDSNPGPHEKRTAWPRVRSPRPFRAARLTLS